jgi:outer membrane protein TolC
LGKIKGQEKAQYAAYLSSVAAHQNVKSNLVASIATAYYQLLAF